MSMSCSRRFGPGSVFALTVAAVAGAQQPKPPAPTGSLVGRVFADDSARAPIPGVAVVIGELGRRTRTDSTGAFKLDTLPAGAYTLMAQRSGFFRRLYARRDFRGRKLPTP